MMDDKRFEAFLREFQPRQPRPIVRPASRSMLRPFVAALVILAMSVPFWFFLHQAKKSQPPKPQLTSLTSTELSDNQKLSLFQLTRLAQNDPRQLDITLDAASRTILPRFEGNSSLASLAKE